MSRPTMRFVPVKMAEQQAALMLMGLREQLVASRTQLSNAIRGYATEFGLTAAKGMKWFRPFGQFGGLVKLGPGCCQAASFTTPIPLAP